MLVEKTLLTYLLCGCCSLIMAAFSKMLAFDTTSYYDIIWTDILAQCKEVFRNNANTDGEQFIGNVNSPEECIQLVQANCDWANIANVHEDVFANESASCWCQKGDDMTPDNTSSYLNCWFGEINTFNTTESGGMSDMQYTFEYPLILILWFVNCVSVHDQSDRNHLRFAWWLSLRLSVLLRGTLWSLQWMPLLPRWNWRNLWSVWRWISHSRERELYEYSWTYRWCALNMLHVALMFDWKTCSEHFSCIFLSVHGSTCSFFVCFVSDSFNKLVENATTKMKLFLVHSNRDCPRV